MLRLPVRAWFLVAKVCLLTLLASGAGIHPLFGQISLPSSGLIIPDDTLTADQVKADSFATDDSFNKNSDIRAALTKLYGGKKTCLEKREVLLVHFARWTVAKDGSYQLQENLWNFYHATAETGGKCRYALTSLKANGQEPLLYRDKTGFLLGINVFDQAVLTQIAYKVSATPEKAENIQNAGILLKAFLGAGGGAPAGSKKSYVAVGGMPGYKSLPFDFNITYTLSPPDGNTPGNGPTALHPAMETAEVGVAYSRPIPYTGGTGKLTFAEDGLHPVPKGLKIESSGVVDGTPTAVTSNPASETFVVKITDSDVPPNVVSQIYSLKVVAKGALNKGGGGAPAAQGKPAAKTGSAADSNSNQTAQSQDSTTKANPTSVDCSAVTAKAPCTYSLSYKSDDLEWWDVGMAVSIPGVKETQYSVANNVVQATNTTHTDVYAMLDLFPFAYWKPKDSYIPHLTVGLPITGKTFYRPLFGVGENVTSWTGLERRNFPLRMSLVGGVVYMKESVPKTLQVGATATAAQLSSDLQSKRVTKFWFGVELSVNSLVGKIKK